MLRCGPKICWKPRMKSLCHPAWVPQSCSWRFYRRKWFITSKLDKFTCYKALFLLWFFCLILLVKNWKNSLKGLYGMCLSYVENFGKCQPLFIRERVDLFSFMALNSSYSTQINTAISRVQKQNPNPNHQYTQMFNLCIRSRVAQVSHTAAKVAFHNIRAFTCWIICCT